VVTFEVKRGTLVNAKVEVLAIAAVAAPSLDEEQDGPTAPPEPTLGPVAAEIAESLDVDLAAELRALRFGGARGTVARIPTRGRIHADAVLVVGLGKSAEIDLETLRRAGAALADRTSRVASLATDVAAAAVGMAEEGDEDQLDPAQAAQALCEGISLAAYRYLEHKSNGDRHALETTHLHPAGEVKQAVLKRGVEVARVHVAAARLARDLVNAPPGTKRPPMLADRIRTELRGSGVKVKILAENDLERGGYGGMIAVGQGSDAPPRLVELTYAPKGAERHVAIVGKGITFDSGGLSIKPSNSMMKMKMDMGGAAVAYAAVRGAAELGLPVKVTGVLALAENMPSGAAQRPGDVYTARNGRTVEVLNTDAEGRLVLSDALAHACEQQPDALVDLATLTGAVVVALGRRIGGLMATDDDLAEALLAASERSGERLWRLPLPDDYREDIDSDVADVKNIGSAGSAGTIIGGLFLREFVADGIPWAHLDIAGLAWSESNSGYLRKGATGAPVRTLLHWLADGA
jgi:leucyl aminopeptidase